jgi:hypothetical protein
MATFVREDPSGTGMASGVRGGLIVLGLALGVLFIAGLYSHADAWLVWLNFGVAVLSLLMGIVPTEVPSALKASPIALGIALLCLWIIALAVGTQAYMAWWTFAFGVAYVLLGVAGSTTATDRRYTTPHTV